MQGVETQASQDLHSLPDCVMLKLRITNKRRRSMDKTTEAVIAAAIAVIVLNIGKIIIERTREKDGKAKKK